MQLVTTMRSNSGTVYTYITKTLSCDEFVNAVNYFYLAQDVIVDLINDTLADAIIESRPQYTYFVDLVPGQTMPSMALASYVDRT